MISWVRTEEYPLYRRKIWRRCCLPGGGSLLCTPDSPADSGRNRLIRRSRNNHRGNKRNSSKWNVCIKCRPFAAFLLEKRNRLCQRNDRLCQSFNKTTTDMVICFHKILRGINKKWRERYVRRNDAGR